MYGSVRWHSLLILFLCLLSFRAWASTDSLRINIHNEFTSQSIGFGAEFLVDETHSLDLQQARQDSRWQASEQNVINFGFTESSYWVRFSIENQIQERQSLVLDFPYPYVDVVEIYLLHPDQPPKRIELGDTVSASQRPILHSHSLVTFELLERQHIEVYIRARSSATLQMPMQLWQQKTFIEADHTRSLLYGLLYGLLLSIALYHILIFLAVKEPAFLNYAMLNICILLAYTCQHGIAPVFFWVDKVGLTDYLLLLSLSGTTLFSSLFVSQVLALSKERKALAAMIKLIVMIAIASAVSSFILPYSLMIRWQLLFSVVSIVVIAVVLILRLLDGYPPAKFVAIAVVFAGVGHFILLLEKAGALPSSFVVSNASYIGTLIMVMLYSFALSYRMNMDRAAREHVQKELIKTQNKVNEDLDRLVRERTEALERANQRLLEMSITDGLTGLKNRRHFDVLFETELKRAYREKSHIGLLLLDIDHFKKLNDNFGHQFGDLCLKTGASLIKENVRRPGDVVARYGGEEFVILLPNTDKQGSKSIARQILSTFNQTKIESDRQSVTITVSVGVVALVPSNDDTPDSVLKRADELLYRAKENGRNRMECEKEIS